MWAGQLALIAAALFAGGALHVALAEQPARLALNPEAMLIQWKASFTRAQRSAPAQAILGVGLGLAAWWMSGRLVWAFGAVLLGANIPFTLILIGSTNRQLLATAPAEAGPASRALVEKWGRLHAGRTVLALAATGAFAWAGLK
ncbi:MAG: hypothetical protein JWO83_3109 [Caulobacteraceae bacterium]|nr:hypothetical protein [Caulobacteraceae bacterium]